MGLRQWTVEEDFYLIQVQFYTLHKDHINIVHTVFWYIYLYLANKTFV